MPEPPTVANSSCLIALEAAGLVGLLERLYGTITVPEAVAQEVGSVLAAWMRAKERGVLVSVRDAIQALIDAQFRVSDALIETVLRQAGE